MTKHDWLLPVVLCVCATACSGAEPSIDGATAPLWSPCTGWTTTPPSAYSVTNENGSLVFVARGSNREMPWIVDLDKLGCSGDQRYLLVRYRARGLSTAPGIYFLHGEEGTRGGLAYAMADDLQTDQQWHILAVDLLAIDPLEVTHQLAIKVFVDAGGDARLEISRLWFSDLLPSEAMPARQPGQPQQQAAKLEWMTSEPVPQAGWTTTPGTDFAAEHSDTQLTFTVRGQNQGMRWLVALPAPVDLAAMPLVSVRYRASGALADSGYAIWLGNQQSGSDGRSVIALPSSNVKADGAWHAVILKLPTAFHATHLAIGLDSVGEQAELTLDTITFSSRPPRWNLLDVLPHETRTDAWHPGRAGFTAEPVSVSGGKGSSFLGRRLGLSDWFTAPQITVGDVPFAVPLDPVHVPQTNTAQFDELSLPLSPDTREVYLLTAAAAPSTEPWGIDWMNPRPLEVLDVPEKVFFEIRYSTGPPDQVLPLDAATGQWGMRRRLSVVVAHPDPNRTPTELVLCDRMQTASFGIVAATTLNDVPRVAEPNWEDLAYPKPPASALAASRDAGVTPPDAIRCERLQASFDTDAGLRCTGLTIAGLEQALTCGEAPIFEASINGVTLPDQEWEFERAEILGAGRRFILRHPRERLIASVDCIPGTANELLLRMTLTNKSDQPATVTVRFPTLSGVRIGAAADTWYLSGKRGGIINSAHAMFHDPLGERHPLQMDGFFNPRTGLALGLLTHDTVAQHHFIHLSKSDEGGAWAIEYPDRDLAPGASFTATEAAIVLREGDWRAIFTAYGQWLKSWFQPVAPRKPWFERTFALCSGNAHYDASPDPQTRGNVQRLVDTMNKYLGPCDYVHLFGWGASKQYGDWGDYDHYEEVGGLDFFRDNVQRVQQQGTAVSVYLDGYLSSAKGQHAGERAESWAMKNRDGSPQFVAEYQSYNECPYQEGWRKHLSESYARVQREIGPKIMYIDEIGATDGRWTCWARDHGHNACEIPYAGEVALLRDIRQAVGPDVVLYTEYPPAEVSRRFVDGSITYQALWSADQEPLAPHFIDLPRFAFPDFKQLHIIYYVPARAGNWWLLKYPFFNGEVYRNGEPNLPGMDAPSLALLKRAIEVQCAHRDAFSSHDVEPLVTTQVAGVFANRFSTDREHVWTLYNANGRTVRAPVLWVRHSSGAVYEDAWRGRDLTPKIEGDRAGLAVELGPKEIGCITQKLP